VVLKVKRPKDSAYPKTLTTWGDHIRKRRLDLGFLQKDVAKQIGVSQDAVFNWETNQAIPDVQCIPQIINFLGYCPWKPARSPREQLRIWRECLGLPKKHLAKLLGVDESTYAKWEGGKRDPKAKFIDDNPIPRDADFRALWDWYKRFEKAESELKSTRT